MARSILLLWSALWRAQALHLVLFVLLPAAAAAMRTLLGVVLLPFLLVSAGERSASLGGEVAHLKEPACWLALLPCSIAGRTLYEPNRKASQTQLPSASTSTTEPEPFMSLPTSFTVRHAWFLGWLSWFLAYLLRRERQAPEV